MSDKIRALNSAAVKVSFAELQKPLLILQHAHQSVKSLLAAFGVVRGARGSPGGMTTDDEQDLLRAMLVLATAGLDSMTKQIIRDALPKLTEVDPKVEQGIETFLSRQFAREPEGSGASTPQRLLARLLVARSHRDQAIEEYIAYLTGGSLQSDQELIKATFALGLEPRECGIEPNQLKPIFKARNNIIHELDINFEAKRRRRHVRSKTTMVKYANAILSVAENILLGVSRKLTAS